MIFKKLIVTYLLKLGNSHYFLITTQVLRQMKASKLLNSEMVKRLFEGH